jgi:hypothetical protein
MTAYRYEIDKRPAELGGGWRLRLIEGGEEVGGGVFPLNPDEPDIEKAKSDSYDEAIDEGQAWLASRPNQPD